MSVDPTIGPLLDADERFDHQIADTFATVAQSDRSWTEKVAAQAAARDGSLQLDFGVGRYPNRDVIDAFAGVSRGTEQWTVRASRALHPAPEAAEVGPIHYEVVEPLRRIRFRLEPNDVQPVAFEWTFEAELPARTEQREQRRSRDRFRRDEDLVRYHQIGTASGWVEVDGARTTLDPTRWFSTRDHSWGVRLQVGAPPSDLAPRPEPDDLAVLVVWTPMLLERADGTRYGLHCYHQSVTLPGHRSERSQGGVEHPDGAWEPLRALAPALRFDPHNRRLLGGVLHATASDGTARPVTVEALGDTGFHLGTGLYFGWEGRHHGEWRGRLHVEGEHVADCTDPAVARRLHQLRDCVVSVDDPVGGGRGWANVQTIVTGPHPDLGLSADTSFT